MFLTSPVPKPHASVEWQSNVKYFIRKEIGKFTFMLVKNRHIRITGFLFTLFVAVYIFSVYVILDIFTH